MIRKLPTIQHNKRKYYVDFRLGELRDIKTVQSIRFIDMPEGKHSSIKKRLRSLRFRTWNQEHIPGIDN